MAVGCNVEEAEKAYRLAEESFLANDIAGAIRSARKAQMLFRSLPGLANAVAAYEVHAAAATSRASGRNWYAVLSVGGRSLTSGGVTHDVIKQRYRRLCLALHPDKNRSAAADSAFKLLRKAWEALSVRHPPPPAAAVEPSADATPGESFPSGAQPRPTYKAGPQASSSAAKPDDYSRPPPASAYAPKDEKPRAKPTPSGGGYSYDWMPRQTRTPRRSIYCRHCDAEFVPAGEVDDKVGVKCLRCRQRLRPPRQSRRTGKAPPPGTDANPPPPPPPRRKAPPGSKKWTFPCPVPCPQCGTQYKSMVSVGMCHLTCQACSKYAMVHVRSPYLAHHLN